MAIGERLFLNNCAQCHGSDARGSHGFPNLTDRDWLYGGSAEAISETITEGRRGVMPALGAAIGSATDVERLAQYVLSLSGIGDRRRQGRTRPAAFRRLRRLPRAQGRGQPGARRAQPDRPRLAAHAAAWPA